MAMFGQTKRSRVGGYGAGQQHAHQLSLPYGDEKLAHSHNHKSRFITIVRIPLPRFLFGSSQDLPGGANFYPQPPRRGASNRFISMPLPIPPRIYARYQQLNPILRFVAVCLTITLIFFLAIRSSSSVPSLSFKSPSASYDGPSSLVASLDEVAKIWEWEIISGHHPSAARVPANIPLNIVLLNPVVPARLTKVDNSGGRIFQVLGRGPTRKYIAPLASTGAVFPPRPTPGSIIDLDHVLERCDLGTGKYVRDCLELLRVAGNLDTPRRVRDERFLKGMQAAYSEEPWEKPSSVDWTAIGDRKQRSRAFKEFVLATPREVSPSYTELRRNTAVGEPCDAQHPRIFHMFWFGPFTDKPYMSILSFLYTQNLALDKDERTAAFDETVCRPQLWVWVYPSTGGNVRNQLGREGLRDHLGANPWSAPFLHPRFSKYLQFREWDTAKVLDAIPEVASRWRDVISLTDKLVDEVIRKPTGEPTTEDAHYHYLVQLSHVARFALTHRYGGIYLEPDTILLRDWEEVWGYRGQFAYRHSASDTYNTAVLKMHRGSALGSFILITGMEHGGDFSPAAVTRYVRDAGLDGLLFRAPDALFDPAWLSVDKTQLERPPFPTFSGFSDFFTGIGSTAAEQVGFDGFFRGAYSYHFHNGWWRDVDPTHNYPDLGPRFAKGEQQAREQAKRDALNPTANQRRAAGQKSDNDDGGPLTQQQRMENALNDPFDLPWATVLKRTFEAYARGEQPNMYGEKLDWEPARDAIQPRTAATSTQEHEPAGEPEQEWEVVNRRDVAEE